MKGSRLCKKVRIAMCSCVNAGDGLRPSPTRRCSSSAWWETTRLGSRRRTPSAPQARLRSSRHRCRWIWKTAAKAKLSPACSEPTPGASDVVCGEETPALGAGIENGLICSAGAHPKWIEMKNGRMDRFATYMIGKMYGLLREHPMVEPAPNKGAVGARILTTTYGQASANSPWLRPQIGPVAKWPYLPPEVCSSRPPGKLFVEREEAELAPFLASSCLIPRETIGAAPCHPEGASRC
jgi:hypothetical protein